MSQQKNVRKNRKIWMIGVVLVIVLAAGITAGYFLLGDRDTASNGLKVQKNTIEWNQDMQSADKNADIQIPYYGDVYMEGGSDKIDMTLVNPKENDCYFVYTFILSDTGEEIYQSDLIEPGRALTEADLEDEVPAGTYKMDIRINTYTMDDQRTLNNAVVSTNLISS